MMKITYYALEYNEPVDGHYRYLASTSESNGGYRDTDVPREAMHWLTEKDAAKYLETFPYRNDFHVQAMLTEDDGGYRDTDVPREAMYWFTDEFGRSLS